MNYETPIKKKLTQFRSQIRTEQLSQMKMTTRTIIAQTSKKQALNDKFIQICQRLNNDCLDVEAVTELKHLYKYEGLVIKQGQCVQLLPIVKDLMKKSRRLILSPNQQMKQKQNKQKSIESLNQILLLLTRNANRYPDYGCFDNPLILDTVMEILRTSTELKIKSSALRLTNFLVMSYDSKVYFLSNNLLSILSHESFTPFHRLIEQLLTNIYYINAFKVIRLNIDQLALLFEVHGSLMFTSLEGNVISDLYHFVRCLCLQLRDEIKKYDKFIQLILEVMKKANGIDVGQKENYQFYTKILKIIVGTLEYASLTNQKEKSIILGHLDTLWEIHAQIGPLYQKVICQISINPPEQQLKHLQSQKQKYQQAIQAFISHFDLCITKLPLEKKIVDYMSDYFLQFYPKFQLEKQMTVDQFFVLIKYFSARIKEAHYPQLINWYQKIVENQRARVECLKVLSQAVRKDKITMEQYYQMADYYQTQRKQFDHQYHELTDFILSHRPIPTLDDIRRKQYEIKVKMEEKLNKEDQENQQFNEQLEYGQSLEKYQQDSN